ncbi:MAG: hypothetical protein COB67_10010 [SAR324 cluster bacterium]|uniref:Beta-lactamase n=1 Tax=SAR324 cluster bacterium TaxID=2024889 RepID=A0A2A4SZ22_9DELT|nr:MAG: hypothetical protein COB67_10010 [SAR324 cluster bacterium]
MKKIILILITLLITGLYANADLNATIEKLSKASVKAYKEGDYHKVIQLEKESYSLGKKESSDYVAMMYRFKLYDFNTAITWYQKGIDRADGDSAYSMACMYEDILKYNLAEKYYLIAVKLGHEGSTYALGLLYNDKLNNDIKAIEWYKKAIDIKDANGAFALGILYRTEKKDYKEAEKWFIKALKMKHRNAPYNLARLYENDLKEYEKAIEVYKYFLASHPNDKEVKETIKRLESL